MPSPSWELFLPALPWIVPLFALPFLARRRPRLEDATPLQSGLVSIIVPARNESETIDIVLDSLRASTYSSFEVVVVDDESTDDTAARVERHSAEDPRIRHIRGAPLPRGWFGKPWACVQGYRAAQGDLILFTDADTVHAPALLGHAVGAMHASKTGLLTIMGHQRCESFWERLVQPLLFTFIGIRFYPDRVNAARRPRDVIANGQFMLVRRDAYEEVGTHETVRGEVAEDLALAQAFHRHGRGPRFEFAESLFATRMYRDLGGIVEGWSKNILLGGRRSFPDEPFLRLLTPIFLLAQPVYLLAPSVALLLWGVGVSGIGSAAVLATTASLICWWVVFRGLGIQGGYAVLYPLGALVLGYIVLRSIARGSGRVEWRGRRYSVGDAS